MAIILQAKNLVKTAENNCWLIEDDYAAEYSYAQHPSPSILAHRSNNHIIHLGTMSKLLLTGLRLGWMVVPEHIAADVTQATNTCGLTPAYALQQQLGLFMQYGFLNSHLAHSRSIYNERRKQYSDFLQQHGKGLLTASESISGMNLYLKINRTQIDINALKKQMDKSDLGCELYLQKSPGGKQLYILLGHSNQDLVSSEKSLQQLIDTVAR